MLRDGDPPEGCPPWPTAVTANVQGSPEPCAPGEIHFLPRNESSVSPSYYLCGIGSQYFEADSV